MTERSQKPEAAAQLVKPPSRLDPLADELGELVAIFGKTWNTARSTVPDENGEQDGS
jgi:hypothetical protein